MKKAVLYILLMLAVPAFPVNVIRQAKENIKKRQNLEQTRRDLLAESVNQKTRHKQKIECFQLAAECSKRINEQENEKLYLKQNYDTLKFFNSIRDMFLSIEQADSVSSTPNEKGIIKREDPQRYRDFLWPYRGNLLKGGMWLYKKGELTKAFDFFDVYIRMAKSNIFMQDNLLATDTDLPMAAYLAVFSAQKEGRLDGVIEHAALAKRAEQKSFLVQEYYARALEAQADTVHWLAALNDGMREFPDHHYFFSHLVEYYAANGLAEKGLAMCEAQIEKRDTVALYWYAKSLLLLKLHRDREAIDACDACLALQPNHVNAYYNKGIASLNLAVIYTEQACTDVTDPRCKRDLEIIRSLYQLARRPMEKVRELAPDDTDRWAAPLYRIYLHLNMGKEFDEMDRILNK